MKEFPKIHSILVENIVNLCLFGEIIILIDIISQPNKENQSKLWMISS